LDDNERRRAEADERIRHLQLIQTVIERIVGNEFLVKGWAFTVAGVFLGFAVSKDNGAIAFVSLIPTFLFFAFDGYLLRTERRFRTLFNHVRDGDPNVQWFFMAATQEGTDFENSLTHDDEEFTSWLVVYMRPAISPFYGLLVLSTLLVGVLAGRNTSMQAWQIWALIGLALGFVGALLNVIASSGLVLSSEGGDAERGGGDARRLQNARRQRMLSAGGWSLVIVATGFGIVAVAVR
jgi:hypothetical protein